MLLIRLHHGLGYDGRKGDGQVAQGGGVGVLGLDGDGAVAVVSNRVNKVHDIGDSGGVDGPLQGELDVGRGQVAAVVELDALADFEDIGQLVGLLPALSDLGNQLIGLRVHNQQGVENLAGDFHRRSLLALMGVQTGHVGALRPDEGVLVARRGCGTGISGAAGGCAASIARVAASIAAAGGEGEDAQHNQRKRQDACGTLFHVFSSIF